MKNIYSHHEELPKEESLIEQAWKLFCETKGWTSEIVDGYTAEFNAYDRDGNLVYSEFIGE